MWLLKLEKLYFDNPIMFPYICGFQEKEKSQTKYKVGARFDIQLRLSIKEQAPQ